MYSLTACTLTIAAIALFTAPAAAQFTISIPKMPKVKKEKPADASPNNASQPREATWASSSERSVSSEPESTEPQSPPLDCDYGVLGVYTEQLRTTLTEAENYRPGLRGYYVQDFNDNRNPYLWAALTPRRRQNWYAEKNWGAEDKKCLDPLLDSLSAAIRKTLPTYQPAGYAAATPAEVRLLHGQVTDIKDATVHKTGVKPGAWKISKNSLGLPTDRYKHGMIWARYPNNDDEFCRLIFVNIVQEYAGGGTYGQSYGHFVSVEPAGCPAGK
jgi:hypothetical protein